MEQTLPLRNVDNTRHRLSSLNDAADDAMQKHISDTSNPHNETLANLTPTTTRGDMLVLGENGGGGGSPPTTVRLAVGTTDGQALVANASAADGTGMNWIQQLDHAVHLTGGAGPGTKSHTEIDAHLDVSNTGADHSFIDQDVTAATGNPTWTAVTVAAHPSSDTQLANKDYVDNSAAGMMWQAPVLDYQTTPPGSTPASGDRYLVKSPATGAWVGNDDSVAEWNGSTWDFLTPTQGTTVNVLSLDKFHTFSSGVWKCTGATIDHDNLENSGTNTHAQIDTHLADATTHYTEASISHLNVSNAGTSSHALIDAHLADTSTNPHNVTLYQITVTDSKGDLVAHDGVGVQQMPSAEANNYILIGDDSNPSTVGLGWLPQVDHDAVAGQLINTGTNTHTTIDAHIADDTVHFTEASISHLNLGDIGANNSHADIDTHISGTGSDHTFIDQMVTMVASPSFGGGLTVVAPSSGSPISLTSSAASGAAALLLGATAPSGGMVIRYGAGGHSRAQPTPVAVASDTGPLTVNGIRTGLVYRVQAAADTWTVPTAAALLAGLSLASPPQVGDAHDVYILNLSAPSSGNSITLGTNTGVTNAGNMIVNSASASHFMIRWTNVTVSTEAYTLYRVGGESVSGLDQHATNASLHFTEASISHLNIGDIGTNSHASIDAHMAGTGADHTFIDQDVTTTTGTPSFAGLTVANSSSSISLTSALATAGDALLLHASHAAGGILLRYGTGGFSHSQAAPVNVGADTGPITAAGIKAGFLSRVQTAANTWGVPTAASLLAALNFTAVSVEVGDAHEFTVQNLSTTAGNTITIGTAAGVTNIGNMTLDSNTSARFLVRWTNVTASTEAYTLYRLGAGSGSGLDAHTTDATVHFTEASITHLNITNTGTNSHAVIDTHLANSANPHSVTMEQITPTTTKGDMLVENASGNVVRLPVGTNNFALLANATPAEGLAWTQLDHAAAGHFSNAGSNTHPVIDAHLASSANPHSVTIDQITPTTTKGDLMVENGSTNAAVRLPVGTNNFALIANSTPAEGMAWVQLDHAAVHLTNIGSNTHAVIDTHMADATLHFTEASISHLSIADIGTNSHAAIDTHISGTGADHTWIDQDVTSATGTPSFAGLSVTAASSSINLSSALATVGDALLLHASHAAGGMVLRYGTEGLSHSQPAPVAIGADTGPITAAGIKAAFMYRTQTSAATWGVPTAASLLAALTFSSGAAVGDAHEFVIQNLSTTVGNTITLGTAAGVTNTGNMVMDADTSTRFMIRWTNVTASTEAYTLYRLGPTISGLDAHTTDTTLHFTEASISHLNIADVGTNNHAAIDGHLASTANPHGVTMDQITPTTTKGDILIENASNNVVRLAVGTNNFALLANSTPAEGVAWTQLDHAAVHFNNVGSNTHAVIDAHLSSTANPHSVTIDQTTPTTTKGDIIVENGTNAIRLSVGTDNFALVANSTPAEGVAWTQLDHATLHLSNVGSNTHAVIDTHIADATLHFTEASISHLNIADIGTNTHAAIDAHIAGSGADHTFIDQDVTSATGTPSFAGLTVPAATASISLTSAKATSGDAILLHASHAAGGILMRYGTEGFSRSQASPTAIGLDTGPVTAAAIKIGFMSRAQTSADTWGVPTAASLLAALTFNVATTEIGDAHEFVIQNLSTTAGNTITIGTAAGVTNSGNMIVDADSSARFVIRWTNVTVSTEAYTLHRIGDGGGGLDAHTTDATLHFTEGSITHLNIADSGSNTHAVIDTHLASTANPHSVTINQLTPTTTKGDILVENASNNVVRLPVGSNNFALLANSTPAEGLAWTQLDHAAVHFTNIGSNSHAVIDAHLGSTANPHSVTMAQIKPTTTKGDILVENGSGNVVRLAVGTNNFALLANSTPAEGVAWTQLDHDAHLSNAGSNSHAAIDTHLASTANPHTVTMDHVTPTTTKGDLLVENGSNVVRLGVGVNNRVLLANSTPAEGMAWTQLDHAAAAGHLTNIGTNSHATIDSHIADATLHFTQGAISHTNIADIGTNSHAAIDAHISGTGAEHTFIDQSVTTSATPTFAGLTASATSSGAMTLANSVATAGDAILLNASHASGGIATRYGTEGVTRSQPAPVAIGADTGPITAAGIKAGFMSRTQSAANTWGVPTAASLLSALNLTSKEIGDAHAFYIQNLSTTAGNTITLGTNTGVTNTGNMVIDANASARFIIRWTNVTASTEAYTLYRVDSGGTLDAHTTNNTTHFTEASISHLNIADIGTNSHAAIDSHIADASLHFTEASINHDNISGVTANDHHNQVHALGGGSDHTSATLAQLNALISDATLDDTTASRPPSGAAGGDLGGTYPNPTVNDGADSTAIHDNVSAEISVVTEKSTPVDADWALMEDSAASNTKKRVQLGNLVLTNFDQRNIVVWDHFLACNISSASGRIARMGWKLATMGGGALQQHSPERGHPGVIDMGAGTSDSGKCAIYLGDALLYTIVVLDGTSQETIDVEWVIKMTGSISSSELERITLGFGDNFGAASGIEHNHGIYVEFDPSTDTHFRLRTAKTGTRSASAGTTVVAVNTWYRVGMKITYPGGTPTAQLVVNGSNEGSTLTTNIPDFATGYGARVDCKGTATEPHLFLDYTLVTQVGSGSGPGDGGGGPGGPVLGPTGWLSSKTAHSPLDTGGSRVLLLYIIIDNHTFPTALSSVSVGGVTMTSLVYTYDDNNTMALYALNEESVAAASDTAIVFTWNDAPPDPNQWKTLHAVFINAHDGVTAVATKLDGASPATLALDSPVAPQNPPHDMILAFGYSDWETPVFTVDDGFTIDAELSASNSARMCATSRRAVTTSHNPAIGTSSGVKWVGHVVLGAGTVVATGDAWQTPAEGVVDYSHSAPAVRNGRCLVVISVCERDTGSTDVISSVTYGGKALTLAVGVTMDSSEYTRAELWYATESTVAAAANDTISVTWPFDTGVLHLWNLDGDFTDAYGGFDGTGLGGGPTSTTGKIGTAYEFDGVDDGIEIGTTFELPEQNSVTITAWFTWGGDANPSNLRIFGKSNGTSIANHVFMLGLTSAVANTSAEYRVRLQTSSDALQLTSTATVTPDTWHLLALWYDGSNFRLYYDGSNEGDTVALTGNIVQQPTWKTRIGMADAGGKPWDGKIDQVCVWDRALSTAELDDLYNSGSGRVIDNSDDVLTMSRFLSSVKDMDDDTVTDTGTKTTTADTIALDSPLALVPNNGAVVAVVATDKNGGANNWTGNNGFTSTKAAAASQLTVGALHKLLCSTSETPSGTAGDTGLVRHVLAAAAFSSYAS